MDIYTGLEGIRSDWDGGQRTSTDNDYFPPFLRGLGTAGDLVVQEFAVFDVLFPASAFGDGGPVSFESRCDNDIVVALVLRFPILVFPLGDLRFGVDFLYGSVLEDHV